MHYLKFTFFFIFIIFLSLASCKQETKAKIDSEKEKINIRDTKEFKDYYKVFFSLSDKDTKVNLPYVNNFMTDNKLFPFKDVCDLLENELVKADQKVYNHWKIRCDFQTIRNNLMEKYDIDTDSLIILIEDEVNDL